MTQSKRRQSLLALEREVHDSAAGRRRGVAGGGSTADDRAQLVAEQRRRRAQQKVSTTVDTLPPEATSPGVEPRYRNEVPAQPVGAAVRNARERLDRMLNIRRRFGDDARHTVADVDRQRAIVADLEAKSMHAHGEEQIDWLAEPVGVPGSKLVVFGFDRVTGAPRWLAEILTRGEAQEASAPADAVRRPDSRPKAVTGLGTAGNGQEQALDADAAAVLRQVPA